ncbi:MAG: small GTP-binding protein [Candidatus Azotimanducaceae bacterium]|jgi:small GTP-binding protein
MIGAYRVGKTSLVERFVRSLYSDDYHTTIGVKIDKKSMTVEGLDTNCMIWDIAGEDEFHTVNNNYLRGMAGYFLVMDGTRIVTLDMARKLHKRVETLKPGIPFVLIANKSDMTDKWVLNDAAVENFSSAPYRFLKTSAKSGENVEEAFSFLVNEMIRPSVK